MNTTQFVKKFFSAFLACLMLWVNLYSTGVTAAMVSTESQLSLTTESSPHQQINNDLQMALQDEHVRAWLLEMGVSANDVEQRIAAMTADELAQFNASMDSMPAGESALGFVALVFGVLIILDLLGTTNIFPVIKPIDQY